MRDRIATGTAVGVVFLAMLSPILLLPGDRDRIEEFLALRSRVLSTLEAAPDSQDRLVRHVTVNSVEKDPYRSDTSEMRRMLRNGTWWRQQSQQITYVLKEAPYLPRPAASLAETLLKLESAGLGKAGLRPLTSGYPHGSGDDRSAVAVQVWSDPQRRMTVIVQATVLDGAWEAHVARHVIEQFSAQR